MNFFLRLRSCVYNRIPKSIFLGKWYSSKKCGPPAPHFVKQSMLLRHGIPNSTWVETGTYLGSTTKLLSSHYKHIHTIEPSEKCLQMAKVRIGRRENITYYNGTSEEYFSEICQKISGEICFWLDGHFSSGITFKGIQDTPIKNELSTIARYLNRYKSVVIFIDDIRCSHIDPKNYPSLDYYVQWAKENNLIWSIELDCFIAKSKHIKMYP